MPDWEVFAQPEPGVAFYQRIAWSPPSLAGGDAAALVSRLSVVPRSRVRALGTPDFCSILMSRSAQMAP